MDYPCPDRTRVRVPVDGSGRITATVRCVPCGYNLRGLLPEGDCPECAAPVSDSLLPFDLRLADPDWLRRVRRGLAWVMLATGAVVGGMLVEVSLIPWLSTLGDGAMVANVLLVVAVPIVLSAVTAGIWGLVLATTPEPKGPFRAPGSAARMFVRIAYPTGLATTLVGLDLFVTGRIPSTVAPLGAVTLIFLPLVPLAGMLLMLATLLERTTEYKLVRKVRRSGWGLLGVVGLGAGRLSWNSGGPGASASTHHLLLGVGALMGVLCLANVLVMCASVRRAMEPVLVDAAENAEC